jgi:hypothetical protein
MQEFHHCRRGTPFIPRRWPTSLPIEDWVCERRGRRTAHVEGCTIILSTSMVTLSRNGEEPIAAAAPSIASLM